MCINDTQGHLLGEYQADDKPVQEIIWLGDTPVAVVSTTGASANISYIWADHLGTPRQITDPASKQILWRWDGEPFGNSLADEDPSKTGKKFSYNLRFPGQYFDKETGKHYNYFRDYDPATGRYIESDPIGLAGGINTYGYVGGNPIGYIDPLGLAYKCKTILKMPGFDLQNCTDDGQNPSEQQAKDAVRVSDSELDNACKKNGYKDAHDMVIPPFLIGVKSRAMPQVLIFVLA
ncbi:hypothetical protein HA050_17270 [Iodobacter sp. HSC-16F04]|uniref:RHS repeat-associated core domain-containing protein n=1 Tax=Iodobacter violaceini TaxID=3044271 RepID=A0ABX0KZG2_9NEIS|nr:RHS repeat-associated core domain-containing protein [Iodobacter violacea]NHQ87862.1 hypothetical protein [Iodobacter violacea]